MNKIPTKKSGFNPNWQIKTLNEVCDKISAGVDKPNDCTTEKTEENQIPIFSNGIKNKGLCGYTKTPTITKPALTISARGTIGFACVRYEPFFPIVRLICVIPNEKLVVLEFLCYALQYIIPQGEGTSVPQLTIPNFKKIEIPIPPLDEQKRIASALSKIDAYLENTIKLIEEKERFKRGIAKKLLTCKEGENIPEARFKGFEGEWEIVKLGDITKMISGGTPNTKIKEYYNGNIVWATITDITNSYKYLYDSEKKITELGLQNSSTKIFPINTVLYSIYGSIGECAISKVECTTNQAILGIECSDKINYNFLYYLLSNHKNNAKKLRQFGTQPNINKKIVLNFCFKIPNIEEQEKIGGYLSLLDAEIDNLKKQKELIKEMKRGAMQKLLSGEVRLSKNAFNENI
mgnify:FL=1